MKDSYERNINYLRLSCCSRCGGSISMKREIIDIYIKSGDVII